MRMHVTCVICLSVQSRVHGLHIRNPRWKAVCRFPGADALRSELEHFVAKHAQRPGLHTLPEAAALLATPAAAKSGDGALQALKNWAPAPLLQACAHSAPFGLYRLSHTFI